MRTAIIDIGTNTINLLIADIREDKTYNIILETACPATLGKGGINNLTIVPAAIERGITALKTHLDTIEKYSVDKIVCIATSAMRDATNRAEFIDRAKQELNLDIKVVDGKTEAELIYDGVRQVVPIAKQPVLILDIGGGSNEFIITNSDGIIWKHSFNLGVARLLEMFTPADPITKDEIKTIETHIRAELRPLFTALQQYSIDTLIGASGSFDTVAAMIAATHHPHIDITQTTSYQIPILYFKELYQKLVKSSYKERLNMNKMAIHRVDTIVIAVIFINFILRELSIEVLWQCSFALKEGSIYQIINNQL
jgi:exopolyphosphatase/guanosine-5'-triphosphate,3'-diphosphate pyrophosphatase